MESLLCLTDYKSNSDQAFRYARYLAGRISENLLLLHMADWSGPVFEEATIEGWASSGTGPEAETAARYAQELQRLRRFAAEHGAAEESEAPIRYLVAGGAVKEHIPELESEYDLGMIVMGMRNRKGLADRLFGNLARKMIDLVDTPLLLIPPEASFREIRSVVYATDFSYDNLSAIELLLYWCEMLDARLYLLHVSEDPEENNRAEALMEKIMRTFEDENAEHRMEFIVQEGDVQEGIEQFIEQHQVDLIALTRHSRSFWESFMASSLAKDLADTIEIPLMVFQED